MYHAVMCLFKYVWSAVMPTRAAAGLNCCPRNSASVRWRYSDVNIMLWVSSNFNVLSLATPTHRHTSLYSRIIMYWGQCPVVLQNAVARNTKLKCPSEFGLRLGTKMAQNRAPRMCKIPQLWQFMLILLARAWLWMTQRITLLTMWYVEVIKVNALMLQVHVYCLKSKKATHAAWWRMVRWVWSVLTCVHWMHITHIYYDKIINLIRLVQGKRTRCLVLQVYWLRHNST